MITIDSQSIERTYRAIGHFMEEFSMLEYYFRHYVGVEIGLEGKYRQIVISYDFSTLCTVAIEAFRLAYENDRASKRDRAERFVKKARALGDYRNTVAHGRWIPIMDGGRVIHFPKSLKQTVLVEQAVMLEAKAVEA